MRHSSVPRIVLLLLAGMLMRPALAADSAAGRLLYLQNCFICHQLDGRGIPATYPPLAGSDYLASDRERSIRIVCEGLTGEIIVNGKKFDGAMPAIPLDDAQVAEVL